MVKPISKETQCVLCTEIYFPVIEPEEDQFAYKLSCSSCTECYTISRAESVRVTLREVLGVKGEALALALETVLAPCSCGNKFSHDAGKRCPVCIKKVERENKRIGNKPSDDFYCPWNLNELGKLEPKIVEYIRGKMDSKEETLTSLIEKFESGEIDAETYLEGVESLQFRESSQVCVIQTWAIILGPEMAFRAAEEHGLVEYFGTRILVSIAKGLEMSTAHPVLTTLTREKANWDGDVQKELNTFIAKIGGGF
ncbi:MAG: hypothetical protein O3A78_11585 [Nitrospinae bacterium]|jgi:hypothetical protein|nr:hypothetical protein [Nitrospinota bacterium]MDA1110429.1 hypothetical protein [Nitrospinota bacterium]